MKQFRMCFINEKGKMIKSEWCGCDAINIASLKAIYDVYKHFSTYYLEYREVEVC